MNEKSEYYAEEFKSLLVRQNIKIQQNNAALDFVKNAFNALNTTILTAGEKYQFHPTLTIETNSKELYVTNKKSNSFKCNVDCLTISHGAITLRFFENTIKNHEGNMLFHFEPHENGSIPQSKTKFDEKYMFEHHSNTNEWFLCICDAEGQIKSEEKFDENGILRVLHNFFFKKLSDTPS
ncbi:MULTISPECIES: hypothetical protein [Yersinia]|uniref:hypothetical protein n=1 Tax=Yersinia TaxID=629 RepID=UPI0009B702A9|nr:MULTISPECIES: hypothetical protein [Yersinia]ARB84891.1 hypothetical protein A6J67_13320 [Yersinia sp. FDAARGOS_228]AVL34682.1 hypothetical protein CEQ36_02935 [Yersinia intermedia]